MVRCILYTRETRIFFFKPATRTRGTAKIFTKGMKMIDGQDWDQMTHCARGSCQKFSHALMLLRAQWKKKDSLPFGNQVKDWHSWFSAVFSPTKLGCAWVYPQRTVWVRKVGMWYRTDKRVGFTNMIVAVRPFQIIFCFLSLKDWHLWFSHQTSLAALECTHSLPYESDRLGCDIE